MRACSGRVPAEETGPHSGPLPGGALPGERIEKGRRVEGKTERRCGRKDGCTESKERRERTEVEGRGMHGVQWREMVIKGN